MFSHGKSKIIEREFNITESKFGILTSLGEYQFYVTQKSHNVDDLYLLIHFNADTLVSDRTVEDEAGSDADLINHIIMTHNRLMEYVYDS